MKNAGSLLVSIIVGIVILWLALKLLGAALKLVGILIAIGIAVAVYYAVRGMIAGKGNGRA
jgi:multisubunit Na+/H+ antiporter MnhE subunit